MKSKQTGITLLGFLLILIVAGFFGYMALKLVPAYTEYLGVVKAMQQEAGEGNSGRSVDDIRRDLMRKMDFQYVGDTVQPQDITVERNDNAANLRVAYDKQIPFLYNIDFLLHFDKRLPMAGNPGY